MSIPSHQQDLFYTEGVEELLEARVKIAEWRGSLYGCVVPQNALIQMALDGTLPTEWNTK